MAAHDGVHSPRWYAVPARALFVTFLVTLLTFAVTLFGSILTVVIAAAIRDTILIYGSPTGMLLCRSRLRRA